MTKENEKRPSSHKQKILPIAGGILCLLLLPILIINLTLIIKSYTNKNEVPNIGKTIPMIVLTDSMYPVIKSGDLILLNKIKAEDINVGDIITYFDPSGTTTTTVTHRVIELTTLNDEVAFRTKGDANNTDDKTIVPNDKLVGIYKMRIAQLGNVAMFMSTTKGLVICVVIPLLLIIGYDLFRRRKLEKKNNADKKELLEELEKLKAEKENSKEQTPDLKVKKSEGTQILINEPEQQEVKPIENNPKPPEEIKEEIETI